MASEAGPGADGPGAGNHGNMAASNHGNVWERPWDVTEMRSSANRWSLASDAGLLLHLQSFSQRLLAQTHSMEKAISEVDREAKMTGVRMNNVLSDFIMLANNQFVENRVYDEDESITDQSQPAVADQQDQSPEQREAELIPRITEALTLGLHVLDTAYEKVDIQTTTEGHGDQSGTTHTRTETLLAPKDPYVSRRMPHLIASVNFTHDDSLGIADLSEEEPVEDPRAASVTESDGSETDDDDDGRTPASHARTKQHRVDVLTDSGDESEGDLFTPRPPRAKVKATDDTRAKVKATSDSDDSDMFGEDQGAPQSDRDELSREEAVKSDKPASFLDELANKVGGPPPTQLETSNRGGQSHGNTTAGQAHRANAVAGGDDLFAEVRGQASDEDDDDDLFAPSSGRFTSRGGGLFDDDEEGGLFGSPVVEKKAAPKKQEQAKTDNDRTSSKDSLSSSSRKPGKNPAVGKSTGSNLFGGDESEDEDDIFASAAKSTQKTASQKAHKSAPGPPKSAPPPSRGGLFGEESGSGEDDTDSLFQEPATQTKQTEPAKKKLPPGGVPMFGAGGNPLIGRLGRRQEDTPTDESGSDTDDDPRSSQPDTDTSSSGQTDIRTAVRRTGGQRKQHGIQVLPTPSTLSPTPGAPPLFTDDTPDIFSETATKPANSTARSGSRPGSRPGSGGSKVKVTTGGGLFGDKDEDLFAAPKTQQSKPSRPAPALSGGLFGEDDDDLFSSVTKPKAASSTAQKPTSKPKKTALSLFDEDEAEDEDDIFASVTKQAPPERKGAGKTHKQVAPSSSRVFTDEGALFGDPGGDDTEPVDLFGAGSPLASPTKTVPAVLPDTEPTPPTDHRSSGSSTNGSSSSSTHSQGGSTSQGSSLGGSTGQGSSVGGSKASSGPSLFDADDDEDLFAVTTKAKVKSDAEPQASKGSGSKPKARQMTQPSKPKAAPAKKAPSIFDDDEEDLFGTSSSSASGNKQPQSRPSKPSQPPSRPHKSPASENNNNNKQGDSDPLGNLGTTPPIHTQHPPKSAHLPAAKPQNPVALPKPQKQNPVALPKPQKQAAAQKAESDSVDWSDDDDEEDLFGDAKKKSKSPSPTPPSVTPNPPVSHRPPAGLPSGAVSMFGGLNPAAVLGRSKVKVHEDEDSETCPSVSASASSSASSSAGMLGQVGFDQPAASATLQSTTKSRARIAHNRRPPSRKTRQNTETAPSHLTNGALGAESGTNGALGAESEHPGPELDPSVGESTSPRVPDSLAASNGSLGKHQDDLLGSNDAGLRNGSNSEKDIFGDEARSQTRKAPVLDSEDIFGDDSVDDVTRTSVNNKPSEKVPEDIFSSKPSKEKRTNPPQQQPDEEIFQSDLFPKSSKASVRPKETKPVFDNDDDYDIFADDSKPKTNRSTPSDTSSRNKKATDDEEDIFGSSTSRPVQKKPVTSSVLDEDDLFGASASAKPKTKTNKTTANTSDDFDIFASSKADEDIFASSTSSKSSTKSKDSKSKAAATKKSAPVVDIFADDTDIFADVSPPKARSQRPKKDTSAGLFSDDVDDIFATPQPKNKPAKSSTSRTKRASKPTPKAAVDDIFGDNSASIFDDPLSATRK